MREAGSSALTWSCVRSVGSHKANFTMNPAFLRRSEEAILDLSAKHSPLIAGYDCPAGSAIFFTENLCQCVPSPLIGSTLAQCCRCRRRRRVGTGLLGGAANPVLVAVWARHGKRTTRA